MENTISFGYEDVVGNLVLTLTKNDFLINEISYDMINDYAKILKIHLFEKDIISYFKLDDESKEKFLFNNYYYNEKENKKGLNINHIFSMIELIKMYQEHLPIEVINTIYDDKTVLDTLKIYSSELNKNEKVLKK